MPFDGVGEGDPSGSSTPWPPRKTAIEYVGSGPDWLLPIYLLTWCFDQVYSRDRDFDEIVTPAALLQVMATYLAGLSATTGLWREALMVLAVGVVPVLTLYALAGAVVLATKIAEASGIPTDL